MARDGAPLEQTPTNPTVLTIQDSSSIRIVVEHVQCKFSCGYQCCTYMVFPQLQPTSPAIDPSQSFSNLKRPHSPESPASELQYPLKKARNRHGAVAQQKQEAETLNIEWLKSQATNRPGYKEFNSNKNRKLKNPERVQFWNFVSQFSEKYFKALFPAVRYLLCILYRLTIIVFAGPRQ